MSPGPHIEGASAEQGQQAHSRYRRVVGLAGEPKANTRQGRGINAAHNDVHNPQQFTDHPRITNVPAGDEPVNDFVPHLPGRIPPAGWDGEPGAASPTAGWM